MVGFVRGRALFSALSWKLSFSAALRAEAFWAEQCQMRKN